MPITHGHGNPDWTTEETILALDVVQRNWPRIPGKRSPEVKVLSDLIRRLPFHGLDARNEKFRNTDGVYLKLQNLASLHPDNADRKGLRTSRTDRAVWEEYWEKPDLVRRLAEQIAAGIEILETADPGEVAEDEYEAVEGTVLIRVHRVRERKRGFRARVIRRVEAGEGKVICEACGIAPRLQGDVGLSIFEVHHAVPLSQVATTVTRLDDLVLLCSNCHRMIHAVMREDGGYCSLKDFWHRIQTGT